MKRALLSLKLAVAFVVIITTSSGSVIAASPTISQELVENKKTVYELPETGMILPNNPLFHLKRFRDETALAMSHGQDRAKLLIQLADRYTSYGQKMTKMNKPQSAFALFEQSIYYQEELASTLKKLNKENNTTNEDICYKAIQSNIKQSEVIRGTLDDLSVSDQAALAKILEKNIGARKLLEICDK